MKKLWSVLLCVLFASPVSAQPDAVWDSLQRSRALYPTPMRPAQVSEMLSRALVAFPGWHLLRKEGGTVCPTPYPNGVTVSCDWVIDTQSGWGYDVLYDQEGMGRLTRSDGVPNGVGITTVAPWPVGTTPQDPQQPQTPVTIDYDRIRVLIGQEVAPILTYLANMQDNDAAIRGDIAKVSEQVRAHDEKTNVIIAALKNAKTYLVAGSGLLGWLLPKLLSAQPQPQPAP